MAESGEAFTRQYVALPGCSEHQTGLAIDLGRASEHIDFIRPDFPTDGVCGAFRRLAARYGFIERYPRGREAVTGIAHEPWHFRYVGAPHALLLTENGLCLEEYPDFLRAGPRTVTLDRGRRVTVSMCPAQVQRRRSTCRTAASRCRVTTRAASLSPFGGARHEKTPGRP